MTVCPSNHNTLIINQITKYPLRFDGYFDNSFILNIIFKIPFAALFDSFVNQNKSQNKYNIPSSLILFVTVF